MLWARHCQASCPVQGQVLFIYLVMSNFHFLNVRWCNIIFSHQKLTKYLLIPGPLLQSTVFAEFLHAMVENLKSLKDTLAFLPFVLELEQSLANK